MMLRGFKSKVFGTPHSDAPELPVPPETPPPPPKQSRRLEDRSAADDSIVSAQSSFKGEINSRAGVRAPEKCGAISAAKAWFVLKKPAR